MVGTADGTVVGVLVVALTTGLATDLSTDGVVSVGVAALAGTEVSVAVAALFL